LREEHDHLVEHLRRLRGGGGESGIAEVLGMRLAKAFRP